MTGLLVLAANHPEKGIITQRIRLKNLVDHTDQSGKLPDDVIAAIVEAHVPKEEGVDHTSWRLVHLTYPEFPVVRVVVHRGRADRAYMSSSHAVIEVSDVDYKVDPTKALEEMDEEYRLSGFTRYNFEEAKEGGDGRCQGVS
jgi:hypothetical protein